MSHLEKMRAKQQPVAAAPKSAEPDKPKKEKVKKPLVHLGSILPLCDKALTSAVLTENVGIVTCPKCHELRPKTPKKPKLSQVGLNEKRMEQKGRLPIGSYFGQLSYVRDGCWHGSLHISDGNLDDLRFVATFGGEASGIFKLLALLDGKYRDSLRNAENRIATDKPGG